MAQPGYGYPPNPAPQQYGAYPPAQGAYPPPQQGYPPPQQQGFAPAQPGYAVAPPINQQPGVYASIKTSEFPRAFRTINTINQATN